MSKKKTPNPLLQRIPVEDVKAVAEFLKSGGNVHQEDDKGATALIWAAWNGHVKTAQLLIDHGADIDSRDDDGRTALIYAALQCHQSLVKTLIENGADALIEDNYNMSARTFAIKSGHHKNAFMLENRPESREWRQAAVGNFKKKKAERLEKMIKDSVYLSRPMKAPKQLKF